jgi:hypothetical protein
VTMRKAGFAEMLKSKDLASQQPITDHSIDHAIRAINTSYTAAATGCLLVVNGVTNHFGAKNETKQFWEELIEFSLFSKALWKIYVEEQFVVTDSR